MSQEEITSIIESWLADIRRGTLSLYVLMLINVLQKENLNYGYTILKEIEKRSPQGWPLAEENTLYPLLRRLNQTGLLNRIKVGRKQHYLLSDKGRLLLDQMKNYWHIVNNMMENMIIEEGNLK